MSAILDDESITPTSVRYLVLLSSGSLFIFDLLAIMTVTTLGTQGQNFLTGIFLPITTVFSAASLIEWFLLRKSNSKKVAALFYLAEAAKLYLYGFYIPPLYNEFVGGGTNTFLFIPLMSILSVGIFTAHKFAPGKYEWLTKRPLTKRFVNLLPTLVVISLFMGTYLVEISGLAPTRQTEDLIPWENQSINWDAFGPPPDWNARYYLEDLLSQFLNGISFPDEPIFNVTNLAGSSPSDPATYWRLAALTTYEFENREPFYPDWNQLDSTIEKLFSTERNSFYSSKIPDSSIGNPDTSGKFRVDIPVDLSSSIPEPQISASFPYYIPTTWNDQYGGYVDLDESPRPESIVIPSTGETIFPTAIDLKEIQPSNYLTSEGLKLALTIKDSDVRDGVIGITQYTSRYLMPDYTIFATLSGTRDDYQRALDPQTWQIIKTLYLQIPNTPGVDLPSDVSSYSAWAPNVFGNATKLNQTSNTPVYQQIATDLQALGANGTLGLQFDTSMWLREYASAGKATPRPDPYQDFNEWFITTKNGTSLHFSSLLATVLRLQGIPSRIAYGFIGGNDTMGNFQKIVITRRFIHTWVETLVPLRNPLTNNITLSWMPLWFHLDPLFYYLVGAAAMTQQQSTTQAFLYDPIEYQNQILSGNLDVDSIMSNVVRKMGIVKVGNPDTIVRPGEALIITIGAMQIGGGTGAVIPQGIPNINVKLGIVDAQNTTTEPYFLKNFEAKTDANGTVKFTLVFNSSLILDNAPNFGYSNYYLYAEANVSLLQNGVLQNVTISAWSRDVYQFQPSFESNVHSQTQSTNNHYNKKTINALSVTSPPPLSTDEEKLIRHFVIQLERSLKRFLSRNQVAHADHNLLSNQNIDDTNLNIQSDTKIPVRRKSVTYTNIFDRIIQNLSQFTIFLLAPFSTLFNVIGTIPLQTAIFHRSYP